MNDILDKVHLLLKAYKSGKLGDTTMPEDTHPEFADLEAKRLYYTLPMALNYQRNSYKLWEAAKATVQDGEVANVFDLMAASQMLISELRDKLLKHKLALQPNKHIDTWRRIASTIVDNWETVTNLFKESNNDYIHLRMIIQKDKKSGFPYLSGPKIFNYWSYIMSTYGEVPMISRSYIEIAPDTHVIQASVKLGLITEIEAKSISRETLSAKWRSLLKDSGIDPIDVHSPLWFWSRAAFVYKIE